VSKLRTILQGWKNVIFETPEVRERALLRSKVCDGCEYAKKGIVEEFIQDDIVEISGYVCTKCTGCPLKAKIRADEKCIKWPI